MQDHQRLVQNAVTTRGHIEGVRGQLNSPTGELKQVEDEMSR